jgi:hypothetical protein
MLDHLEWNSLDAETLPKSLCYAKLHTIWLPSIQTSISHLRLHSHDTAIVFDTNPSPHPLTTSNSVSSLIQLSFGMLYHLVLSLLLPWISLNHRSKPTTSKQFSILYICKYVTFSFLFFVTLLFCLLINCKYMVCSRCTVVTIDGASYDVDDVDLTKLERCVLSSNMLHIPILNRTDYKIEMVQLRAARYVTANKYV